MAWHTGQLRGKQALAWGLANHVSEPGHVLEDDLASAAGIAANGPLAVRQAKKSIHFGLQGDLLTGCRFEIEADSSPPTTVTRACAPSTRNARPTSRDAEPL